MMAMAKKSHNSLLIAADDLGKAARRNGFGRHERVAPPYYMRLQRTDAQFRLILAHRDRSPSADEMQAVLEAAGAPVATEYINTHCVLASQDGSYKRLPALVASWREV